MLFTNSILEKFFTAEFLLFSWNDLKNNKQISISFREKVLFRPISALWFEKTALLLKNGKFSYKKIKTIKINNYTLKNCNSFYKAKIVENAFLLIVKPYFYNNFFFKNFDLTQCLRIFFTIYNC